MPRAGSPESCSARSTSESAPQKAVGMESGPTKPSFRPRPIDVNAKLLIVNSFNSPELIEELERESAHFAEIEKPRKRRKFDDEFDRDDLRSDVLPPTISVPTFREVELEDEDRAPFVRGRDYIVTEEIESRNDNIEYDLEGEDEDFLWAINTPLGKRLASDVLTENQLESLIDLFEREHHKCSMLRSKKSVSDLSESGSVAPSPAECLMSTLPFFEQDEDVPCSVCYDRSSEDDNLIVYCDGCDIGVHQICYGVQSVPEGHWFCGACRAKKKDAVRC
eukprot:TRINITY_DN3016_c0_g1_i1.p1 TRINITY_DN3016_c0_g1~~TRINITY_DN3016_c0_g1_i1.p1  ORF type:complete len:278 (-),score=18.00 TRINITY_DN3016_c0_g1_i1:259-1092(-)